jgi:hypothetical protein
VSLRLLSVRSFSLAGVVALLALSACAPESHQVPNPSAAAEEATLGDPEPTQEPSGTGGKSGAHPVSTGGSAGGSSPPSGEAPSALDARPLKGSARTRQATCSRWKADRADLDEGRWTGNLKRCDAGALEENGIESALRMVNLYRWLADLPAVTTTPARNRIAQACALLQDANFRREGLDHDPPRSWDCYSDEGAAGALTSNLSGGPGVTSVGAYMLDLGNEEHLGHRRIILSNFLGPIGLGSTGPGGASCMQAIPGSGDAGKAWLAWPPPGYFPSDAYSYPPYSLDSTGWSIQSEDIDLSSAEVEVRVNGTVVPVRVTPLHGRSGSTNAIRIVPLGWRPHSSERHSVTVTRTSTPIAYEFATVDC